MSIARLLRTVRHLTLGQVGWRIVHEARLAAYRRLPSTLRWQPDPNARFVGQRLSAEPFSDEQLIAERWRRGQVAYHGVIADRYDWTGRGHSRLWRYEHQYHRELVTLAAAGAHDDSWLVDAHALVASWSGACPPPRGDGWEPYPVARRILNWSLAGSIAPSLGRELAPALAAHLRFLEGHLERHLLGNHLLCDASALVAGAAVLDGDEFERLGTRGLAMLQREVKRQVLADGGYAERTIQYHSIVLMDLVTALGLWRRRGRALPPSLLDATRAMATLLARVRRIDGSLPWLNDAAPDATPPSTRIFALARSLGLHEAVATVAAADRDVELADTGWHIARHNRDELLFDVAPLGPDEQPGHGHSDTLSFELWWDGVPVIVDTGTTTYEPNDTRMFERSARAHAVVAVDDDGPDELWSAFRVGSRARASFVRSTRAGDLRVWKARLVAPAGWQHERAMVFWPGRALVVLDDVRGVAPSRVCARLPLAPGCRLDEARLHVTEDCALDLSLLRGNVAGREAGWVGEGFGQRRARETIRLAFDDAGRAVYAITAVDVTVRLDDRRVTLRYGNDEISADAS